MVYKHFVVVLVFALTISSCKITRHVPDGSYLLNKQELKCKSCDIDRNQLESYIKQKPNRRMLYIFRFHLHAYNLMKIRKEKKGKVAETVGEEPVIYSEELAQKSLALIESYAKSRGYYNVEVHKNLKTNWYNKKKLKVMYEVKLNEPYTINSYTLNIQDKNIEELIVKKGKKRLLTDNAIFDIELLKEERARITRIIRNNGYFEFTESDVVFQADTSKKPRKADLELFIKKEELINPETKVKESKPHKIYIVDSTFIYTNFDNREYIRHKEIYLKSFDTLRIADNVYLLYKDKPNIKPKAILRYYHIQNQKLFNDSKTIKTQNLYNDNSYFKTVNIQYLITSQVSFPDTSRLNCFIQLSPFTQQSYSIDLEGTNSSSNLGAEVNFSYMHKNLFKGSENMTFKLKTSLENTITEEESKRSQFFNTQEYGGDVRLELPSFLLPVNMEKFNRQYSPKTLIQGGYSYRTDPNFTRPATHFSFGYFWKPNSHLLHQINPIDINGVTYPKISPSFQNKIDSTYIFKYSFKPYFISSFNYSLTYLNKSQSNSKNYIYLYFLLEPAGTSSLIYNKLQNQDNSSVRYIAFNSLVAQYLKTDIDFRYYAVRSKSSTTVLRGFAGIAYPIGINVIPSIKQYYSGGANSIRAWTARSLGPGSHRDSTSFQYFLGDIKLEANLEHRFHMFWQLNGALFVDVGNIWTLKNDDKQEAGNFGFNTFYKEIAIGTGVGLRLDFSFFVFRFDTGIKARDPSIEKPWMLFDKEYPNNRFSYNIGIGYPF